MKIRASPVLYVPNTSHFHTCMLPVRTAVGRIPTIFTPTSNVVVVPPTPSCHQLQTHGPVGAAHTHAWSACAREESVRHRYSYHLMPSAEGPLSRPLCCRTLSVHMYQPPSLSALFAPVLFYVVEPSFASMLSRSAAHAALLPFDPQVLFLRYQ